ncbi:MAG: PAS domain-containing protein [Dehalococcoidia bacterium]|nr:PAS domain-containing protein [Dehalococcoidia bacterium]
MPGEFSPEIMAAIGEALPFKVFFSDDSDIVRYYNKVDEENYRASDVIGGLVQNCHHQETMSKVDRVLDDLKSGREKVVEFWMNREGHKWHTGYFAVRDKDGKYLGCLEVMQDVTSAEHWKTPH